MGGLTLKPTQTFAVFIDELESLHKSESLLNRPAYREVIDGHLAQNSFLVNDEQAPVFEGGMCLMEMKIGFEFHRGILLFDIIVMLRK